jgi:hypothetical protein
MTVMLALTATQVDTVLAAASPQMQLADSLTSLPGLERMREILADHEGDAKVSTCTLRALVVQAALPADGSSRTLADIASDTGFPPSTLHRYLQAWQAAGLITQDPQSRVYSLITGRRRAH